MRIEDSEVADIFTPTGDMCSHTFRSVALAKHLGNLIFSETFQLASFIRRTAAMVTGNGFSVACQSVTCQEIYHAQKRQALYLSK